jgi:hypothetical protein
MKERQIHHQVPLMPHQQAAESSNPGKGSFHFPPFLIATELSAVHHDRFPVFAGRDDQLDSLPFQPVPKLIVVMPFIGNHSLRLLFRPAPSFPRHPDRFQRGFEERVLGWVSRNNPSPQWNPFAIDHHQPLRTLAPLGLPDSIAPFFAGAKLPSAKVSSHFNRPLASNSPNKVCQIFTQIPSSSHWRIRRQQVEGLGYSSGRSHQRAPVLQSQRIPSRHRRFSTQGRPPLFPWGGFGIKGSSFFHIRLVKSFCRAMESSTAIMPDINNDFNRL